MAIGALKIRLTFVKVPGNTRVVYPLWSIKVAIWVGFCLFATIILPDKNKVFLVQNGTTPPYTAVQPGNNLSDTALYHIEKYIQCKLDKISAYSTI